MAPQDQACARAAACGSVRCLAWLRSNDWVLSARVSHEAAMAGQLDVLKYLFDVGVTFDHETLRGAGSDAALVEWLLEHGCVPEVNEDDSIKEGETALDANMVPELPAGDTEEERLLQMALVATARGVARASLRPSTEV
eukprot:7085033-Prymnesium_polylepis.1